MPTSESARGCWPTRPHVLVPPAVEHVVAAVPPEPILPLASVHDVGPAVAEDDVVTGTATQNVRDRRADDADHAGDVVHMADAEDNAGAGREVDVWPGARQACARPFWLLYRQAPVPSASTMKVPVTLSKVPS